jgi:hypothetical protein
VLPAGYAAEHVHLGYAATEHGNQGDTTTTAIELVSDHTSRRGLYVGATRGRDQNLMLVVTESHDLSEARDTLERVLANDRIDLPAIAQRRTLAETVRPATPRQETRRPRCTIPPWVDALNTTITDRLVRAEAPEQRIDEMENALNHELDRWRQRLTHAECLLDPHRCAIDEAREGVEAARRQVRSATWASETRRGAGRLGLRRAAARASEQLTQSEAHLARVESAVGPEMAAVTNADDEIRRIEKALRRLPLRRNLRRGNVSTQQLRQTVEAIGTWRRWANGDLLDPGEVVTTLSTLATSRCLDQEAANSLFAPLRDWAVEHGLDARHPTPHRRRARGVGIQL